MWPFSTQTAYATTINPVITHTATTQNTINRIVWRWPHPEIMTLVEIIILNGIKSNFYTVSISSNLPWNFIQTGRRGGKGFPFSFPSQRLISCFPLGAPHAFLPSFFPAPHFLNLILTQPSIHTLDPLPPVWFTPSHTFRPSYTLQVK